MPDEQNRKTREQWRHARINKFVDRQRQAREWINFGDVADFCAREAGSIMPDETKRRLAYDELADALIKGEFDRNGRPHVLYLHPWSKKARMTWEWLMDIIQIDVDHDRGQSEFFPFCWAPRELMERWFDKRRLSKAPALFSAVADEAATALEFGSNDHKRQAVDSAIAKFGVNALVKMTQKAREQMIVDFIKREHSGLIVTDRYVRKQLSEARKERKERIRS